MKKIQLLLVSLLLLVPIFTSSIFAQEDYEVTSGEYEDYVVDEYYYDEYDYDSYTDYQYPEYEDPEAVLPYLAVSGAVWAISFIVSIGAYIFMSIALQKIGKEMNYENPWFAWVPILNMIMIFHLGEQNPLLLLIGLIPGVGAIVVGVLYFIALMKITEKRGYDKALTFVVLTVIGFYILLYLLAWKPKNEIASTQA